MLPLLRQRGGKNMLKVEVGEMAAEANRRIAKVVRKVGLCDQPTDFAYWQSQSHIGRLSALEEIRQEYHGWKDGARPRLQSVYTIVKR